MRLTLYNIIILGIWLLTSCSNQPSGNGIVNVDLTDSVKAIMQKAVQCKPHPRQLAYQESEFNAFIHFGVNTFTGREWGTGFENPEIFIPEKLDTDQWCEAIKAAGMKMVVFTAKHHDGFCLWQTRYTDHSVASSKWMDGKGDVLMELVKSLKKYDLKLGVYLSPADLYQIENPDGLYGNLSEYSERTIPRPVEGRPFKDKRSFSYRVDDYNEYFMNQLFELLTEYGPVHEVWFDGAHPKRKGGQTYTYNQWYDLIRKLAPEAVIFGKGPDVRWCGNEAGRTRPEEWSVVPIGGTSENWDWPDMTKNDLGSLDKLQPAIEKGQFLHWYPAETNTSIRKEWFWRDENQKVKSVEEILDVWYRSVGGNATFLLNIPPNTDGLFSERDVEVLENVGEIISNTYSQNLTSDATAIAISEKDQDHRAENVLDNDKNTCWMPEDWQIQSDLTIELPEKRQFNRIVLQEDILNYSQRVAAFEIDILVEGDWKTIYAGTTIGYKRICRTQTVMADQIRLRILDSRISPTISNVELYYEDVRVSPPQITRNKDGQVMIMCEPAGPAIRYTLDGSQPTQKSEMYDGSIGLPEGGIIKAISCNPKNDELSEVVTVLFDICPSKWEILDVSSQQIDYDEEAFRAIDGNDNTIWMTTWKPEATQFPHYLSIDLSEELALKGFSYTPPQGENKNGTIQQYSLSVSVDGKNWNEMISHGSFDNIINNPVKQMIFFEKEIKARYIKFVAEKEINNNPWAAAAEIGIITK